jgi:hypothetical protein
METFLKAKKKTCKSSCESLGPHNVQGKEVRALGPRHLKKGQSWDQIQADVHSKIQAAVHSKIQAAVHSKSLPLQDSSCRPLQHSSRGPL